MNYAKISNFGTNTTSPCSGDNDPLTMCLTDSMDKSFQNGSIGHLYGPRSRKCQLYMAQRCADKWDGFCEYFYKQNSPQGMNGQWPYNRIWPDTVQPREWESSFGLNVPLSTGEQLLKNTAERKYCTYVNCEEQCEPFDPTNPNSPTITYFTSGAQGENSCLPICRVDPKTTDQDPVMNRMLDNSKATAATIINICNTSRREGTDLSGTRLGAVCQQYQANKQRMASNKQRQYW